MYYKYDHAIGVRSLQFNNDVLSVGSGAGSVSFYDLRASGYPSSNFNSNEVYSLDTTCGWVVRDNLTNITCTIGSYDF